MLWQRVVVALIGLPVLIGLVFGPVSVFTVVVALALLVAAWEFQHLTPRTVRLPTWAVVAGTALPLFAWGVTLRPGEGLVTGLGLAVLGLVPVALVAYERGHDGAASGLVYAVFAAVYFGVVGGFLIGLRAQAGAWAWLWALSTVWVNDSMAYFVGRAWGRHRLSPRLSPKKTWEGFLGGVVAAVAYGMAFPALVQGLGAAWGQVSWGTRVSLPLALALLTPLGDLAESLFKRSVGVKDSGHWLPGHGGIFDRIDAWLWAGVLAYWLLV
ncbi:MAG: phosphatidate cytidylyltransferase [Chloroflexi bacterium]|nr:phosphatidate cytidylyltransferase [Chloroflexota bacterium]